MTLRGVVIVLSVVGVLAGVVNAGDSPRPKRYSGRTFEEWQQAILDLEPETRLKSYRAMVAFARHGHEKEAVALITEGLDLEETVEGYRQGYQAANALGVLGEPLLVKGLGSGSAERETEVMSVLNGPGRSVPGDALVEALLQRVKNKGASFAVRNQACRILGGRVMAHAYLPAAADGTRRQNPAVDAQAKRIVPVLEEQLRDPNPRIGTAAAVSLMRFSIRDPKLMATVLDYADSELTNPRPMPAGLSVSDPTSAVPPSSPMLHRIVEMRPDGTRAMRYVQGGIQVNTPVSELLNEVWTFHRQPDSRETLLQSLKHLKSVRDKNPARASYLSMVIAELEGGTIQESPLYAAPAAPLFAPAGIAPFPQPVPAQLGAPLDENNDGFIVPPRAVPVPAQAVKVVPRPAVRVPMERGREEVVAPRERLAPQRLGAE